MKSLLLSVLLFHTLLSFSYKLSPIEINGNEGIHCFFGYSAVMDEHNNGNISNSCFVNMGASYLVIDSGPTFSYAKQTYEKMKKIKNLPISYVFNTHVHDDHWLGNSYYKTLNADIIGSESFRGLPILEQTRMQRRISADAYKDTKQIKPNLFVKDEQFLTVDNQVVYVKSVNHKAHTDSDLYVYIPNKRVVFVGDLVFNDRIPSIRDGNLKGWIETLDEIQALDVDFVIGGHGDLVTKKSLVMTYDYLKELHESVSQLIENGEELDDVVNMVVMKKFQDINLYDSLHRQNVETAYRIIEWESD